MYIRRKVFSVVNDYDLYERYFATIEEAIGNKEALEEYLAEGGTMKELREYIKNPISAEVIEDPFMGTIRKQKYHDSSLLDQYEFKQLDLRNKNACAAAERREAEIQEKRLKAAQKAAAEKAAAQKAAAEKAAAEKAAASVAKEEAAKVAEKAAESGATKEGAASAAKKEGKNILKKLWEGETKLGKVGGRAALIGTPLALAGAGTLAYQQKAASEIELDAFCDGFTEALFSSRDDEASVAKGAAIGALTAAGVAGAGYGLGRGAQKLSKKEWENLEGKGFKEGSKKKIGQASKWGADKSKSFDEWLSKNWKREAKEGEGKLANFAKGKGKLIGIGTGILGAGAAAGAGINAYRNRKK